MCWIFSGFAGIFGEDGFKIWWRWYTVPPSCGGEWVLCESAQLATLHSALWNCWFTIFKRSTTSEDMHQPLALFWNFVWYLVAKWLLGKPAPLLWQVLHLGIGDKISRISSHLVDRRNGMFFFGSELPRQNSENGGNYLLPVLQIVRIHSSYFFSKIVIILIWTLSGFMGLSTLPETNSSHMFTPENRRGPKRKWHLPTIHFQG